MHLVSQVSNGYIYCYFFFYYYYYFIEPLQLSQYCAKLLFAELCDYASVP